MRIWLHFAGYPSAIYFRLVFENAMHTWNTECSLLYTQTLYANEDNYRVHFSSVI